MKDVTIRWSDNNEIEVGYKVYRSSVPMNTESMPTPIATLEPNTTEYIDSNQSFGNTNYYRIGAFTDNDEIFSDELEYLVQIDTGPGSGTIIAGDSTAGFYGEVSGSDIITYNNLATQVNLSAGTSQFNDESLWLKFSFNSKILFIAKKPPRHSLSWDQLNSANIVSGKTVNIAGENYIVRCITGGVGNPTATLGGEWNALMYNIHVDDPNGLNWNIDYVDDDLGLVTSNGRSIWCQETYSSNTSQAMTRGGAGITSVYYGTKTFTSSSLGWRPVLEWIPPEFQ